MRYIHLSMTNPGKWQPTLMVDLFGVNVIVLALLRLDGSFTPCCQEEGYGFESKEHNEIHIML